MWAQNRLQAYKELLCLWSAKKYFIPGDIGTESGPLKRPFARWTDRRLQIHIFRQIRSLIVSCTYLNRAIIKAIIRAPLNFINMFSTSKGLSVAMRVLQYFSLFSANAGFYMLYILLRFATLVTEGSPLARAWHRATGSLMPPEILSGRSTRSRKNQWNLMGRWL